MVVTCTKFSFRLHEGVHPDKGGDEARFEVCCKAGGCRRSVACREQDPRCVRTTREGEAVAAADQQQLRIRVVDGRSWGNVPALMRAGSLFLGNERYTPNHHI